MSEAGPLLRAATRIGVLAGLVLTWHVAVATYGLGGGFVPTPMEVVRALADWIGGTGGGRYVGTWVDSAWASVGRVLSGFGLAVLIGVPIGILIGRYRLASDLLDPLVQILRPIPVSAWVPFAIILFGIRPAAAIFLVAIGSFFPVVLNTAAGARHVSELHLRSAKMLGSGPLRTLYAVVLPSSLPSILTGLRLAMGLAWVLVIVAEMVSVRSGLGYELWNAYYYTRLDVLVACMVSIGAFGYVADQFVVRLSRSLMPWHRETSR